MSHNIFVGDNNSGNVAAGDINVIFTHVKSTPCIEPLCDAVIAINKADVRRGLCSTCYKNEEAKEKKIFRQRYAVITYVVLGLMLSVAISMLSVLVAEIMTNEKIDLPYPWILVGVIALFICWAIFFGVSYEKIERKYQLKKPEYKETKSYESTAEEKEKT